MVDLLRQWWDFALYVIGDTPALKDAIRLYPFGCALGIYWTQGVKRAQRRNRWRGREHLSSFELRMLSGGISACVIALMAWAFIELRPKEIVAHAALGGAAAPMLMWAVIEVLKAAGTRWDWARLYVEGLRTGDRRKCECPQPPPGVPERRAPDPNDDTGEFWGGDLRP